MRLLNEYVTDGEQHIYVHTGRKYALLVFPVLAFAPTRHHLHELACADAGACPVME